MKTNWAEKVWVNGPLRVLFQRRDMEFFRGIADGVRHGRVLEVGCGQGTGIELILSGFHPQRIDAVDIDPAMVRRAERRFYSARKHLGGSSVRIQVGDAEQLPFPTDSMDAVFDFGIIHHLEDWERGISEISRALKPTGIFYFEEIYPELYANAVLRYLLVHPTENRFRGPEFRGALERHRLRLVQGYRESKYTILGAAVRETTNDTE